MDRRLRVYFAAPFLLIGIFYHHTTGALMTEKKLINQYLAPFLKFDKQLMKSSIESGAILKLPNT